MNSPTFSNKATEKTKVFPQYSKFKYFEHSRPHFTFLFPKQNYQCLDKSQI